MRKLTTLVMGLLFTFLLAGQQAQAGQCAGGFVTYGSDPTGYYGECWQDGTGYYWFEWPGNCLATGLTYSQGFLDLSYYGFTAGFYFYGFEPSTVEDFIVDFDNGTSGYASGAAVDCIDCAANGEVTCPDGTCAATEADCPAWGGCPAGQVEDCDGSYECYPESWIGDGFADCQDQAYGADLSCYDCDGGDCPDSDPGCSDPVDECEGQAVCWDGTCAPTQADCPMAGCEEIGGYDPWMSDGYCDTANNNYVCDYDGGDCCPGDCVDETYNCSDFGGSCSDCLDPDSVDQTPESECYQSCEELGEGLTCWDLSCVDDLDDCLCAPGDANDDDVMNISDIVLVVQYIIQEADSAAMACIASAGDFNQDGSVDVLDIAGMLISILGEDAAE